MTNEELIAYLQNSKGWPKLGNAAADCIESLTAKLAKVVKALEEIAGNDNAAGRNPQLMADKARATLAEIKGYTK